MHEVWHYKDQVKYKIDAGGFESSLNNTPLTSSLSSFAPAFDRKKKTVMCAISFWKPTNVTAKFIF